MHRNTEILLQIGETHRNTEILLQTDQPFSVPNFLSRWTHKRHGTSAVAVSACHRHNCVRNATHTVMSITRCWNWHCLQGGTVNLPKQTARTSGGVKELSSVSSFFTTSPLSFQSISITFISLAHSAASKPPMSVSSYHPHQYHFHLFIFCKMFGFTFAKYLGSLKTWQKWQHAKHSNRQTVPESDTIQQSSGH